jgi:hypothetical protein
MRPLPHRPAVPGARGNAPGHPGPVVGATKVPSLRQLPRLRRWERPLAPHPRRCRRCEKPLAPSPTAVSSFRGSPGAGPPPWPCARISRRSGPRPRYPLRGWLARFSPNPSSRNCSCSSPAGKAALFPHPRRSRRCASPARGAVVVARGHWLPRPPRCPGCEKPPLPPPTALAPFRESPGAGSPPCPNAKVSQRSGSRPRYQLRGWLARFSPNPSSRNYSCSRPSNQQFQPGAWPCSNGFEVGQAQAELRVGRCSRVPLAAVRFRCFRPMSVTHSRHCPRRDTHRHVQPSIRLCANRWLPLRAASDRPRQTETVLRSAIPTHLGPLKSE